MPAGARVRAAGSPRRGIRSVPGPYSTATRWPISSLNRDGSRACRLSSPCALAGASPAQRLARLRVCMVSNDRDIVSAPISSISLITSTIASAPTKSWAPSLTTSRTPTGTRICRRWYDFWETVLFGASGFRGNPLAVHLVLAGRVPLGPREFGRWLESVSRQR